jgi:hypothetical protein
MADNRVSVLERPYSERQLIVVADDAVVEAAASAELQAQKERKSVNWLKLAEMGLPIEASITVAFMYAAAKEAFAAWSRARANGLKILQVGRSQASSLSFPPGHPRDGVLYVGHPAIPNVYYTIADFHRITFEHKFSEAVDLLMHLGATVIRVEHVQGWSQNFSTKLSIPLSPTEPIGATAGHTQSSASQILYEANLKGSEAPRCPDGLVWYSHEPTWQAIAKGRINFGLRDFSLSVSYQDDFGVNAGLKATVQRVGLELGGTFEDHASTVWRISGRFGRAEPDAPNTGPQADA